MPNDPKRRIVVSLVIRVAGLVAFAGFGCFGAKTPTLGFDHAAPPKQNVDGPLSNGSDQAENGLKKEEAIIQFAERSEDLPPTQRAPVETKLKQAEETALLAQQTAELATAQRNALEGQLKQAEGKNRLARLVRESAELSPTERSALEAQLKEAEGRAQLAQIVKQSADLSPTERSSLEARMKQAEGEALLAKQNADLAAVQRNAIELQLRKAEDQLERVKRIAASSAPQPVESSKRELTNERKSLPLEQAKAGRALPLDAGPNARPMISTQPLLSPANSARH
jgi:hypothetical protein